MRGVVSVGTGKYRANLDRLRLAAGDGRYFFDLPTGCPDIPYAFKPYAIMQARERGYDTILWCDSSVAPIRSLDPLWTLIEQQGYWFSDNWNWNCGQWTSDEALTLLGITREEAFTIPHLCATAFGLDFKHRFGREFFSQWLKLLPAFKGPWTNENGEASSDKRVLGHRHDQTALSVIVHRMGLNVSKQPQYLSDSHGETEETILKVCR